MLRKLTCTTCACVLLAACSAGHPAGPRAWQDSHSADQIFAAAVQSRAALHSVEVLVKSRSDGTVLLDVTFDGNGGRRQTAQTVDDIVAGGHRYFRGSQSFWHPILGVNFQTAALEGRVDAKWVDVTAAGLLNNDLAQAVSDPAFFATCLGPFAHGALTKAGVTTISGRRAIRLDDAGNAQDAVRGSWYIAIAAPHYVLRFVSSAPGASRPAYAPSGECAFAPEIPAQVPKTADIEEDFLRINDRLQVQAPVDAIDIRTVLP